jgi:hypothetical protein
MAQFIVRNIAHSFATLNDDNDRLRKLVDEYKQKILYLERQLFFINKRTDNNYVQQSVLDVPVSSFSDNSSSHCFYNPRSVRSPLDFRKPPSIPDIVEILDFNLPLSVPLPTLEDIDSLDFSGSWDNKTVKVVNQVDKSVHIKELKEQNIKIEKTVKQLNQELQLLKDENNKLKQEKVVEVEKIVIEECKREHIETLLYNSNPYNTKRKSRWEPCQMIINNIDIPTILRP